ncbi:MAG: deaminase [archaeon]
MSSRLLEGQELDEAREAISNLIYIAQLSGCTRSKRASIIIKDGRVIGSGTNGPHKGFESYCSPCLRTELNVPSKTRYELCAGEHAERDAIDSCSEDMKGARMYHLALDKKGHPTPADDPHCTLCSGAILKAGLADIVLWHGENNFKAYLPDYFHELSIKNAIALSGLR